MRPTNGNSTKIKSLIGRFGSAISFISLILMISVFIPENISAEQKTATDSAKVKSGKTKYKVTFIELGSVRCIPCQKMQPVMKSIKANYGNEVKVVFHDVWTRKGKPFANKFKVNVIPTQVFLDAKGEEFFRHVGYFPEEELVKVLNLKGVGIQK